MKFNINMQKKYKPLIQKIRFSCKNIKYVPKNFPLLKQLGIDPFNKAKQPVQAPDQTWRQYHEQSWMFNFRR